MQTERKEKLAPGALILGGFGLLLGVIAFVVPWGEINSYDVLATDSSSLGFVDFGLPAAVVAGGLLLTVVSIPVTLMCRGTARRLVALGGLATAAVAVVGLVLVELYIRALELSLTERWGKMSRDNQDVYLAFQAGPLLASLAVLVLALAVARATWPALAVRCYGIATLLAMTTGLVYPWGNQRAVVDGDAAYRDFWFFSFGGLGLAVGAACLYAVTAVALTLHFERRAWWPAAFAAAAPLLVIVAMGFVDNDQVDGTFEGATKVDNVVNNSGVAASYLLFGLVTGICLLVTAVRATRRPATVTVPALDPRTGPPPMPQHPPYAPPASPYAPPGPPPGPQAPPPPGPQQPW